MPHAISAAETVCIVGGAALTLALYAAVAFWTWQEQPRRNNNTSPGGPDAGP